MVTWQHILMTGYEAVTGERDRELKHRKASVCVCVCAQLKLCSFAFLTISKLVGINHLQLNGLNVEL